MNNDENKEIHPFPGGKPSSEESEARAREIYDLWKAKDPAYAAGLAELERAQGDLVLSDGEMRRLADEARALMRNRGARFGVAERCGWFAMLKLGYDREIVRYAAGLSKSSVSNLANALRERQPDKEFPYQAVKKEWDRLGEDEFNRLYATNNIKRRMRLAVEVFKAGRAGRVIANDPYLPSRRADKYEGRHRFTRETVEILWLDRPPLPAANCLRTPGWFYRCEQEWFGETREEDEKMSAPIYPFRTSTDAFHNAQTNYD